MGFGNIEILLAKFKDFIPPEKIIKEEVQKSIKKHTGIDIDIHDISLSGDTIYIKTSPTIKSELYMRTALIRQDIEHVITRGNFR